MKTIIRKMWLSIFTATLVLIVSVATTYAWTGFLSFSTVEKFNVSLKSEEQSDYKILISTDGIHFSDELDTLELKKEILSNMGIDGLTSNKMVEDRFSKIVLNAVSMQKNNQHIGPFVSLSEITKPNFNYSNVIQESDAVKKSYFNFDLYLTFDYSGAAENITDVVLNAGQVVYLADIPNLITGSVRSSHLSNPYSFQDYFKGETLTRTTVNSASSVRVSISKYELMKRGEPDNTKQVTETQIYQGGTALPTLDEGVYSFGGMMEDANNIAFKEYNTINRKEPISIELLNEFRKNRSDSNGKEDAIAIDETREGQWLVDVDEGLNTKTMVKLNVKMWIEGFDADCFEVISGLPVCLNLTFVTKKKVENEA